MVIRVVEFSRGGYKIGNIFAQKLTYVPKGNWRSGELSKIGHHFRILSDSKLMSSKNVINKKRAPKLIFFNKTMRKIRMILDIGKWHWKSNVGIFDTSPRLGCLNSNAVFHVFVIDDYIKSFFFFLWSFIVRKGSFISKAITKKFSNRCNLHLNFFERKLYQTE